MPRRERRSESPRGRVASLAAHRELGHPRQVMSRGAPFVLLLLLAMPALAADADTTTAAVPGFNAIWADDAGGAWAAGDAGVVAETTDGGQTWRRLRAPTTASLRAVWRSPTGSLFVAGDHGIVLRGDRGGRNWRRLRVHHRVLDGLHYDRSRSGPRFRGLWGHGRNIYLVGGEPGAGAALCLVAGLETHVLDTSFPCQVDDPVGVWGRGQELFVQGRIYDCHSGDYSVLDHSTDGGRTWTRLSPAWSEITAPYWLTAGGASYELHASGVVTRQQDGLHAGTPTTEVRTGRRLDHRALWANDRGELYIVGERYTVLHSRDHGATFGETRVATPPLPPQRRR